MAKLLSFSDESRGALEKGVNNLANALKVTIGPKGRNVVIEKKNLELQILSMMGLRLLKK